MIRPVFIPGEAAGAIPNGARVVKVKIENGDAHPIGAEGVVMSSMTVPAELAHLSGGAKFAYFVAWDDLPGIPIGVMGWKIAAMA